MREDKLQKINGFLEALGFMSTIYGKCYAHEYKFVKINSSIDKVFLEYNRDSNISRQSDLKLEGLEELIDWEEELFKISVNWFFFFIEANFHSRDYVGDIIDPILFRKEHNIVVSRFIVLLKDFFNETDFKTHRLNG